MKVKVNIISCKFDKMKQRYFFHTVSSCNDYLYLCGVSLPYKETKSTIGEDTYIYDIYVLIGNKYCEFTVYHSDLDSDMELVLSEMGAKKQIKNKALKELLQSNLILDI